LDVEGCTISIEIPLRANLNLIDYTRIFYSWEPKGIHGGFTDKRDNCKNM
jgi:hypothetical protein